MAPLKTIKIALDWTPNTIHSGLYLAKEAGFYSARGLDVQLLPPDENYTKTPAKRVEDGEVQLAICPSESCIAYQYSRKMKLQGIYAILQRDASAIVSTTISKMSDLGNGKSYGSYNARFEDGIVKQMVWQKGRGGNPDGVVIQGLEGKLSLFQQVKDGKIDATWVFLPWEGVEAEMEDLKLKVFKLRDHGVRYGYSPVIAWNADSDSLDQDEIVKFVEATAEGYELAMKDVDRAVSTISEHCNPKRSTEFLRRSQESINQYYSDDTYGQIPLGRMYEELWIMFCTALKQMGLLQEDEGSRIMGADLCWCPWIT